MTTFEKQTFYFTLPIQYDLKKSVTDGDNMLKYYHLADIDMAINLGYSIGFKKSQFLHWASGSRTAK